MLKASVEVNLASLTQSAYDKIHRAVLYTANMGAVEWKDAIRHAKLPQQDKDAYDASIQVQMTGDFSAEVFTDYKDADEIENGRPQRDLKKMLQTSRKTRVSKKGNRYLIILLRHNITGNSAHAKPMPKAVYNEAKALTKSRVLSTGTRLSATGHSIAQRKYDWGGRLPAGLMPKLKDHHKTDIYAGMVRFDTTGSGKKKSSSYLTFRVMSEKSSGWIIPATQGLLLAKHAQELLQPILEKSLKDVFSE